IIVAAVIDRAHAAIGTIGEIAALNEILSPDLDLVDVQMPCDRVDGAFRDISALGAAVAAIGIDRHRVGDDDARRRLVIRDLVIAGAEIDGVHGRPAARHVGEVGPDIAERVYLHTEDGAVILDRDLNRLGMRPAVARRLVTLGAAFPPLYWNAKLAREVWT